ncbi:MAG: hypothetical protein ABIK54_06670 [candidate division WOR-3 bacterium]
MKDETRRVVAFIAGKLIAGSGAWAIYDCEEARSWRFSGSVSPEQILVYDPEANCRISGYGEEDSYSIYHHGNRHHIELKIEGSGFEGYDYGSGSRFSGSVEGSSVVILDGQERKYYYFTI